ncbi:MAG: hypothetical protein ACRC2K_13135 [Clostridium sp.]
MKALYVFVGYDKHWVDGIAPVVGKYIKEHYDVPVLFCNQQEIESVVKTIKEEYEDHYVYAFDVGVLPGNKRFTFCKGGFAPASMIRDDQDIHIGDMGVIINVSDAVTKEAFVNNAPSKKQLKKRNKIITKTLLNIIKLIEFNITQDDIITYSDVQEE